jgi:hypothetical protein
MEWTSPRRSVIRPAAFVDPCIPTLAATPPAGDAWVHEIKHDGLRLMVWRDGERVRLFTRRRFLHRRRYCGLAARMVSRTSALSAPPMLPPRGLFESLRHLWPVPTGSLRPIK